MAVGKGSIGRVSKAVEKKMIDEIENTLETQIDKDIKVQPSIINNKENTMKKTENLEKNFCKIGETLPIHFM